MKLENYKKHLGKPLKTKCLGFKILSIFVLILSSCILIIIGAIYFDNGIFSFIVVGAALVFSIYMMYYLGSNSKIYKEYIDKLLFMKVAKRNFKQKYGSFIKISNHVIKKNNVVYDFIVTSYIDEDLISSYRGSGSDYIIIVVKDINCIAYEKNLRVLSPDGVIYFDNKNDISNYNVFQDFDLDAEVIKLFN